MSARSGDTSRPGSDAAQPRSVVPFRAAIRVRPGARVTAVGGSAPGQRPGDPPVLLVSVTARAVGGAATAAAQRAVAAAVGLAPSQVTVVRGFTSRDKLVEVARPGPDLAQRWAELLHR